MKLLSNILFLCNNKVSNNFIIIILISLVTTTINGGEELFMSYQEIENSYNNYLTIESQLTPEERLRYLKGFQELLKLYKLSVELEAMEEAI